MAYHELKAIARQTLVERLRSLMSVGGPEFEEACLILERLHVTSGSRQGSQHMPSVCLAHLAEAKRLAQGHAIFECVEPLLGHARWHRDYPTHPTLATRFAHAVLLEADSVLVGVNLTAPGTEYPPHQHSAAEVYLPLSSGRASWLKGRGRYVPRRVGDLVFHAPNEPHAFRTDAHEPLLNLWLQYGNLAGHTTFCAHDV